jgi:hypothetical protein
MQMSTYLIDTYVSEVGRQLPPKNRADIEAEIRSAIQDLLDERARQTGKPVNDEEIVLEVLKEYGDPDKVAASYQGERYLIGPRLYPIFEKIIFIVLPITIVLALVSMGISLSTMGITAKNVIEVIFTTIGNIIFSAFTTVGSIAVIFAIIERTVPEFKIKSGKKEWDPRSLFKVSPPDQVKIVELMMEIFFTGLAILIFNFFPQLINIGYYQDGGWWVAFIKTASSADAWSSTLLSEAFFHYLPALNVIWVLTLVLDSILIQRIRWETWSRWLMIGIKAMSISLAIIMLAGPSLIRVTADSLMAVGFPETFQTADLLVNLLNQVVKLALALIILFGGVDLVKILIRLLRAKAPVIINK